MPRPVKCRKVCHFPNVLEFLPADDTEKKMPIVLTVDEYETIRLLDKKGYSQETDLFTPFGSPPSRISATKSAPSIAAAFLAISPIVEAPS